MNYKNLNTWSYLQINLYIYIYTCVCVCMRICVFVCVIIFSAIRHICVYMITHIHTALSAGTVEYVDCISEEE